MKCNYTEFNYYMCPYSKINLKHKGCKYMARTEYEDKDVCHFIYCSEEIKDKKNG